MLEPEHSEISPSNFDRLAACLGNVAINRGIPEQESSAAWEGTKSHAVLEVCAREGEPVANGYIGCELEAKGRKFIVNAAHVESANATLDLLWRIYEPGDFLFVETTVRLERIGAGIKGQLDLGVLKAAARHLHIIDHKNGMKIVDVNTRQLKGYAYGGWVQWGKEYPLDWVTVWISQPNAPHAEGRERSVTYHVLDLIEWAEEMRAIVERAKEPNAPRVAGDHCTFCKAAQTMRCPEFKAQAVAAASSAFGVIVDPTTFDAAEMGARLAQAPLLRAYLKKLDEFVKTEARKGNMPAGFKWIAGKGERSWADDDDAISQAIGARGYDLWERVYPSPAQAEKLIGKEVFATLAKTLVRQGNQAPRLVPASHSSEALTLAEVNALGKSDAFEAISHPE